MAWKKISFKKKKIDKKSGVGEREREKLVVPAMFPLGSCKVTFHLKTVPTTIDSTNTESDEY